ncbi:hypothetical protein AVEN_196962-1 [Araneus ventricosus]|uniref:Uncharacterized protein n=1 Tax=Araneus ventricosus TaxID=182803 RepID=A0A4Y2IGA2_ARAVE|nr:hypothetical protein AVEN_196962-1 [Araneus ventricosus]
MCFLGRFPSCKSSEELEAKLVSAFGCNFRTLSVSGGTWVSSKNVLRRRILSISEVANDSLLKKLKEFADLVEKILDSNVRVEEYVKIDDDLSIEKENLHVSDFIHRNTTEALLFLRDDDEESLMKTANQRLFGSTKIQRKIKKHFF